MRHQCEGAELRANTGQQFRDAERLGDVVVGAGLKAADDIKLPVGPGRARSDRLESADRTLL
jgi:hypothetical protein